MRVVFVALSLLAGVVFFFVLAKLLLWGVALMALIGLFRFVAMKASGAQHWQYGKAAMYKERFRHWENRSNLDFSPFSNSDETFRYRTIVIE
ncbi:MAG TPA: hypothetical protein PKA00_03865 [Saprospiraceae bacterium]|nr:hypothetical protein [Saprospiraceae bacterium]HMQ82014.1 hypothetical protein [Saprospiraceae bacterium]